MLTPRGLELFNAIKAGIDKNGYAPSYGELAEALELKSKSSISRLMDQLEERGFVRRLKSGAYQRERAVEIIRLPSGAEPVRTYVDGLRRALEIAAINDSVGGIRIAIHAEIKKETA